MAYLQGFGSYLPQRRVTNDDLAGCLNTESRWILNACGIEERRYADCSATIADLAFLAAKDCLQNTGKKAEELDLILLSSGSAEKCFPGPASSLAAKLGLSSVPAIDLSIASAGTLVALSLASNLTSVYKNILIVGSEIMSRRISFSEEGRDAAMLFGDGAGACLISSQNGFARIVDSLLYTDGNYEDLLQLPSVGTLQMKGREVILQACRKIPHVINDILSRNQISPSDIDVFLLHQANLNLITRVAHSLQVPEDRFYCNMAKYGNTSSASMLIAAVEWWENSGRGARGPMLFSAFGSGLNWGALLAVPS
jgi:3-oxoacyl-[acyl-carrier-protein] synthase-3